MAQTDPMNPKSIDGLTLIELLTVIAIVAILATIWIPMHCNMGSASGRTIDASNIRQLGQASFIYANDNGGQLPGLNLNQAGEIEDGSTTPNIHAIAAALAGGGTLNDDSWLINDPFIWISLGDSHPEVVRENLRTILQSKSPRTLSPEFAGSPLSFQFIAGLNTEMSSATPLAFTRGLQPDGKWAKDKATSIYGNDGGHIVFLGGNVSFRKNLQEEDRQLKALDGRPTANILETIDSSARIFSYPATATGAIDGMPGIGR